MVEESPLKSDESYNFEVTKIRVDKCSFFTSGLSEYAFDISEKSESKFEYRKCDCK
jgi:hypothetical protein